MVERRFAIIGHRAPSQGKINLNDLAGSSGRIDVLCRAVNSALFLSHGLRDNSHITLHLMGGPGMGRRIWFEGKKLRGVRVDERSIAGLISKILQQRAPAIGTWEEHSQGLWHSPGDISDTLVEWEKESVKLILLDANAPTLWTDNAQLPQDKTNESEAGDSSFGFFLSDDQPFTADEFELILKHGAKPRSIGNMWLQGHSAIAFIQQLLDINIKIR